MNNRNISIKRLNDKLNPENFIQPIFISSGNQRIPIKDINNSYIETVSSIIQTIENDIANGITKFMLFFSNNKSNIENIEPSLKNIQYIATAIKNIKDKFKNEVFIISDLCLCSYTLNGECFIEDSQGNIDEIKTYQQFKEQAILFAKSGVDAIGSSSNIKGAVQHIKKSLSYEFNNIKIISYGSKFHSNFYGGFKGISCSKGKNRHLHQISYIDGDYKKSAEIDISQGAEFVIIKPAIYYTHVISDMYDNIKKFKDIKLQKIKLIAYNVLSECISINLMHKNGYISLEDGFIESWMAIFNSGADLLISYEARNLNKYLNKYKKT